MDRDGRSCSISDVPEGKYELSATLESDGRPPEGNHYIADVRADGRSVFDTGFHVGVDPVFVGSPCRYQWRMDPGEDRRQRVAFTAALSSLRAMNRVR